MYVLRGLVASTPTALKRELREIHEVKRGEETRRAGGPDIEVTSGFSGENILPRAL